MDTDWPRDVLEHLLAKISEIDRNLAANLFVSGCRDIDATRLSNPLKPSRDVDAIAKNVIPLDQDVPEGDADPKQHTPILRDALVALGHDRLHRHRAFDRIDDRGKLKQHAVPRGLDDASAMFPHESVSDCSVFAKGASGADLVEPHEPRVARNVSSDNAGCARRVANGA